MSEIEENKVQEVEKTLEERQKIHEENAEAAQTEIQEVLTKRGLALVANYVKELKTVHLELIPLELKQARDEFIKNQQDILTGEGDPIAPNGEVKPETEKAVGSA